MASLDEEIGFDLDMLLPCQTVDNTTASKLEYLRKSIRVAKKRTLVSNALVTQVLALRKELDAAQNSLIQSNRERDEWYTSYNNLCECNKNLEMEIQKILLKKKELEEKCFNATNQCDAVKSHANQLQVLVKENEIQIDALKIENKLEKANVKDHEKTISMFKKKRDVLLQDICLMKDVLLGKKKLRKSHKILLKKYKKLNDHSESDEFIFDEEDIENNGNIFDDAPNFCNENMLDNNNRKAQNPSNLIKNKENENNVGKILVDIKPNHVDNGHDSDCANELISLDTGRGSSLASSDSDKYYHSPDYVMDSSPLSIEIMDSNKEKRNVTDIATSPIPQHGTIHMATSPIIFEDVPSHLQGSMVKEVHLVDRNTSPIIITKHVEVSTSPIKKLSKEVITSSKKCINRTSITENIHQGGSMHKEKECLELNNSNNLCEDSIIDCEIETILNTMRINHTLLTPIPLTPSKSRENYRTQETNAFQTQSDHSKDFVCKEAARVKEENKKIKASLADLANEVKNIKCLLNNQLLSTNRNDDSIHSISDQQIIGDNNRNTNDSNSLPECDRISSKHILNSNSTLKTSESKGMRKQVEYLLESSVSLKTPVCDTKVANQTEALSTFRCDYEILQEPLQIKSPPNIAERLESNDSVSSVSINTVPTDELSTNDIRVSDDEILQESIANISSTNMLHTIQNNDSVTSHSIVTIVFEELSTNDTIADPETSQEPNENNLFTSPNTSLGLQFEETNSLEELVEDAKNKEKDYISETTNLITLNNTKEQPDYETSPEYCLNKSMKRKKTTKLEKLRKKMVPKGKIKCALKPLKKSCKKPKPLPIYKKDVKESDSAESLNDRSVYEKALKIMSELKSKQKVVNKKSVERSPHGIKNVCTEVASASSEKSSFIQHYDNNSNEMPLSPRSAMMTRSRSKNDQKVTCSVVRDLKHVLDETSESPKSLSKDESEINAKNNSSTQENRKRRRQVSTDQPDVHCKRMLRSSIVNQQLILECETESKQILAKHISDTSDKRSSSDMKKKLFHDPTDIHSSKVFSYSDIEILSDKSSSPKKDNKACKSNNSELSVVVENHENIPKRVSDQCLVEPTDIRNEKVVSYNDLELFSDNNSPKESSEKNVIFETSLEHNNNRSPKNSILCVMLQRYGMLSVKNTPKKAPGSAMNLIGKRIEDRIAHIITLPANETKDAMDVFVAETLNLDENLFIMGLMKYLKDPTRRAELYKTVHSPPAPCMTKSEQVLLYVVIQMKSSLSADIVFKILDNIEYTLFKLNQTPEFATVESMSHFYAVLCRYFRAKSRLRLFILDAMYCIQFKAVALIKQCLDVWMHILPLAHMGVAKSPLVTCLVYLLHFYKCEDKFNRVQDIRNILSQKYFYEISEWNEPKVLDMFKSAIKELKDVSVEKKMLRMALIIVAKRHGPKWCQNNIIKNLLLPMIDNPNSNSRIKHFCISMIGPLLKPYPVDMKVHCEVIMNQLLNMLEKNPSCAMKESILVSLIFMSKHNQYRVNQALLSFETKQVSHELESVLRDYVKEKPLKAWKTILSKISLSNINKE